VYSLANIIGHDIKNDEIGGACSTHGWAEENHTF